MNHTTNFLLRVFGIVMVSCCGVVMHVFGDDDYATPTVVGGSTYTTLPSGITVSEDTITISQKILCPAGQYVYKCGNYRVGFAWLRGISSDNTARETSQSKNYYISDNQSELLEQMRAFFNPNSAAIEYCADENCTSKSSAGNSDRVTDRNKILNSVCNPFDSNTAVTCAYCPDSATVGASSVEIDMSSETLSASNWVFHTIADCYMQEFTDSTGTYKYVSDNDNSAQKCYYSNTNTGAFSALQGDSIAGFASGTNTSNTAFTVAISDMSPSSQKLQSTNP